MAFDWISNLFQSEQTRGLSGGSHSAALALDDSNPYYNYRLRKHKAEGDLVYDPSLLWFTSPYVKQRSGLGTHVAAEQGEGIAGYTDVLLILSRDDYARATGQDEPWLQSASKILLDEFENHCQRENVQLAQPARRLGFRILCDGSADMGGQVLGLEAGEFVSGLLPNLYTGPVRGSHPVIGVHLNIPGAWDGYQEVGRLYSDQLLFTLGSHWLDNFSHPALAEAALYRLQQYPNGSFAHIINPDLQDRFQVTSTKQGEASVLTLATRGGDPLAYMVLAVMEAPEPVPSENAPSIDMPDAPAEVSPEMAPPMLLDEDVINEAPGAGRQKTIIPDAPTQRIFTLQERGALLQKVHFSAFMLGYDVYLSKQGELGTVVDDVAATFQVRKRSVSLVADIDGIEVNGRPVTPGVEVPLDGNVDITMGGQKLEYHDLREHRGIDGWPYVGEIRRPASSTYMMWGEPYRVGRSRECRVVLPDEVNNDNIHWKPSVGEGTHIRARTGEIPKSRFYTDSIMVASMHAEVLLVTDEPWLRCTANHCYSYIRRGGEVIALFPASSGKEPQQLDLEPGDEILIGNCLFHVGYTPPGEAVAPAPAPKVELSTDSLVDAVSEPNFDELDQVSASEAPGAAALGEPSAKPIPVDIEQVGMDSILGEPVDLDGPGVAEEGEDAEEPADTRGSTVLEEEPQEGEAWQPEEAWTPDHSDETSGWDDEKAWEDEAPPPASPEPSAAPGAEPPGRAAGDTWDPKDEAAAEGLADSEPAADPVEEPPPAPQPPPVPVEEEAVASPVAPAEPPPPPPPPASPEPTAAGEEPPAADAPDDGWGEVVAVDDDDAQFELGRPLHVVHVGWMVNGSAVLGNHTRSDLVLPENRLTPEQELFPFDYMLVQVRGRRGSIEILAPEEVLINGAEPPEDRYEDLEGLKVDIIRRDDRGDEDFTVRLSFEQDRSLPDPRARLIAIDHEDPLAGALLTLGLPRGTERSVTLAGISMTMLFDRENVTVTDYLASYKKSDENFHPFFVQKDGKRFKTAPEDGVPIELSNGDRLVVGQAVYVIRQE